MRHQLTRGGSDTKLVAALTLSALWGLSLATARPAEAQAAWTDPSPHIDRRIVVEPGLSVEVLDWKGGGRPILLLAQLGQTAHIYDDWAVTLAGDFRVLAMTRRGYGQSSGMTENYSTDRLARDILAVIEAERLQKPILVGHGFAGEEMSWIGVNAPDRIGGLVYLDAAYDRSDLATESALARRIPPPPAPPLQSQDMQSIQGLAAMMSRALGGRVPEAEVRQLAQLGPDGRVVGERTAPGIGQRVLAQFRRVDPADIQVPVLALYAPRMSVSALPGCQAPGDASVRQACDELYKWMTQQLTRSKELFAKIRTNVRIVDVSGANSFMFLSNPTVVTNALKTFASGSAR